MRSRTLQILAGISVFAQMIWFDPTVSGYLPAAYSYIGHHFSTYELLLYLLPVAGIAIFVGIWKLQSWAWAMSMILSLFVLFQSWVCWRAGHLAPISSIQIAAALICCLAFFAAARDHVIKRKDLIAVLSALMIAVPIVYIRSMYFRSISIDYDWPIPPWLEIWDHSDFVGTKAVFLWWVLYCAIVVTHTATSAVFQNRSGRNK